MSYAKKIAELAQEVLDAARHIDALEQGRAEWMRPESRTFQVGGRNHYVVRKDGSVTPGLEEVQREAIALHDRQIFKAKSRIEGLRFKLVQVAKEGGANG